MEHDDDLDPMNDLIAWWRTVGRETVGSQDVRRWSQALRFMQRMAACGPEVRGNVLVTMVLGAVLKHQELSEYNGLEFEK